MLERCDRLQEMIRIPSAKMLLLDGGLFLLLLLCLAIRCTHGLDLSDEMQYYGQIASLVTHGRLFESDLFVQQLVYLPFYPLFKLHAVVFNQDGLVLFGRTLLALLLVGLYIYARRWMVSKGATRFQAAVAALALTFAVPYHGIFAISYNTIAQLTWAVFLIWFWDWSERSLPRFVALVVLTGFAHPIAAIVMGALISLRFLLERRTAEFVAWLCWGLAGCAVALCLMSLFTTPEILAKSLTFSRGFGVGAGLFSRDGKWQFALLFVGMLLAINAVPARWLAKFAPPWILLTLCWVYALFLLFGHLYNGYTASVMQVGGCLVLAALIRLRVTGYAHVSSVRQGLWWLTLGICTHFLTLVVTSSNGLGQGVGAVFVALPLLVGVLLPASGITHSIKKLDASVGALSISLLSVFIAQWSLYPYRDDRWYTIGSQASWVLAFRYIKTSQNHIEFLTAFQEKVGNQINGRPALIVSEYPALYFSLNAVPQTCMLYMHSTGSLESASVLKQCINQRHPSVLLDVYPEYAYAREGAPIKLLARQYAQDHKMACKDSDLDSASAFNRTGMHVKYRLCQTVYGEP